MMREYYCKVNEGVKPKNTNELLDECYRLIVEARCKLPKATDYQIHVVLPKDDFISLHYALAKDMSKLVSATNSTNPFVQTLFDAILHESQVAEKVFVF